MANKTAPADVAAPQAEPAETAAAASPASPAHNQGGGPPKPGARRKNEGAVREGLHGARDKTRETLHRASSVARGAIEGNVKRVEKIHHVSTVMLEEASYDPSLRFVLVAVGLFLVFIILLVLSKVMG